MNRNARAILVSLVLATAPASAIAEQGDFYGAVLGGAVFPDHQRNASQGLNAQLLGGWSISSAMAVEASTFYQRTRPEGGGDLDRAAGGSVDLHFGARQIGRPFFLLGIGGQYDDEDAWPMGNVGVGYYPRIDARRDLVRLELRWNTILAEDLAGVSQTYNDFRLNIGFAFNARRPSPAEAAQAQMDADGDGVPDLADRCPTVAATGGGDGFGCPADADRDGVPDGQDVCPNTPAGEKANEQGCAPSQRDTDGDSVTDDRDLCPESGRDIPIEADGCIMLKEAALGAVHFGLTADGLNEEGFRRLDHIAAALRARPNVHLELEGYADTTGASSYNMRLSTRRGYAAREYLVYRGVERSRLKVKGEGESKPIADDRTEKGRAQNRRVEFRVIE